MCTCPHRVCGRPAQCSTVRPHSTRARNLVLCSCARTAGCHGYAAACAVLTERPWQSCAPSSLLRSSCRHSTRTCPRPRAVRHTIRAAQSSRVNAGRQVMSMCTQTPATAAAKRCGWHQRQVTGVARLAGLRCSSCDTADRGDFNMLLTRPFSHPPRYLSPFSNLRSLILPPDACLGVGVAAVLAAAASLPCGPRWPLPEA